VPTYGAKEKGVYYVKVTFTSNSACRFDRLLPACAYQGGKTRIAAQLVDLILRIPFNKPLADMSFYDVCCGCGAFSIELRNRGIAPNQISMLDLGPWGRFWETIGTGCLDENAWNQFIRAIPSDPEQISSWIKKLSQQNALENTVFTYLVLQAASFGGKAIWINNNKWCNTTFRSYWKPTATSKRRSPVNPMMPMPETLRQRVLTISQQMRGIRGFCADAMHADICADIIYIDPPYGGLTQYGYNLELTSLITRLRSKCKILAVSEAKPLPEATHNFIVTTQRTKGGISGNRQSSNPEILSVFTDSTTP